MILANLWADLPRVAADCCRWVAASGLSLNVAKCVVVPLWCFSDAEVVGWLRASCPSLAGCAVELSARYLGVELGRGSWAKQWAGVAAKLLRRTGEVVNGGEALGTRLLQYRVYYMSLAVYRAQFASLDSCILVAHR